MKKLLFKRSLRIFISSKLSKLEGIQKKTSPFYSGINFLVSEFWFFSPLQKGDVFFWIPSSLLNFGDIKILRPPLKSNIFMRTFWLFLFVFQSNSYCRKHHLIFYVLFVFFLCFFFISDEKTKVCVIFFFPTHWIGRNTKQNFQKIKNCFLNDYYFYNIM